MTDRLAHGAPSLASKKEEMTIHGSLYQQGISVIIPTYQGCHRWPSLLDAVIAQSLDPALFELIVVINGPDDGTADYFADVRRNRPDLNLRVARSLKSGAGVARNIGLSMATREYVTFVDDDDEIEPDFLAHMWEATGRDTLVVAPMADRAEGTPEVKKTTLSQRIQELVGKQCKIHTEPWVLGFNACKLMPTIMANQLRYDETLTSGEDVAYFAGLLAFPGVELRTVKDSGANRYIRSVREQSVSRQSESFQFNVLDRLACISSIQKVQVGGAAEAAQRSLCTSQFGFIDRFWSQHPAQHEDIRNAIAASHIRWVPWERLNERMATQLVFSYCFPPYADTAAMVTAKLVMQSEKYVDVISADMSRVRKTDDSLVGLVSRWISKRVEVKTPASFANWNLILDFAEAAVGEAEKLAGDRREPYQSIYSRVMWPGSHLAAYLYKKEHPDIPWIAEFSDPMRVDANARKRECPLSSDATTRCLLEAAGAQNPDVNVDTGFDLIETLTLIHADEIVFTNVNQRDTVLATYGRAFAERVAEKSIVRPQPVPTQDMYRVFPPAVDLPESTVNVGYFGNFYPNRGLGEVFDVFQNGQAIQHRNIHFYIFTANVEQAQALIPEALQGMVTVGETLPYLSFLSTSRLFDVLFVGDAETKGTFNKNPFFPSKYSDYKGSGAMTWAHVELGSPLSTEDVEFRSTIGNRTEIDRILMDIASSKASNVDLQSKGVDHRTS